MPVVDIEGVASAFGASCDEVRRYCSDVIEGKDFSYVAVEGQERDELVLHILKKMAGDRQVVGASERRQVWEDGWKENLREYVSEGRQLEAIVPKFVRPGECLRLNRDYAKVTNAHFELDFLKVFRFESSPTGVHHPGTPSLGECPSLKCPAPSLERISPESANIRKNHRSLLFRTSLLAGVKFTCEKEPSVWHEMPKSTDA